MLTATRETKISSLLRPFSSFKETFKSSKIYMKIVLLLECILLGPGILLSGEIELGLISWLILYLLLFSSGYVTYGYANKSINISVFTYVVVFLILIALAIALWYFIFNRTVVNARKKIKGEDYTLSYIASGIEKFFISFTSWWKEFIVQYKASDEKAKCSLILSFFVFGVPLMVMKEWVKGLAFFLIQILSILYMIARGFADIQTFFLLGVDDKFQSPLVYGIIAMVVVLLFIFIYVVNIKQTLKAVNNHNLRKYGPNFKNQLKELGNKNFYVTSLIIPVLGAVVFTIIPLAFMIVIAFTNYSRVVSPGYSSTGNFDFLQWVGIDTFKRIFNETANLQDLLSVFAWTIIWALLATFTCYFGGLFLAMLLNKKCIKGKVVYRSLFVIAMAMPQFVSLLVMRTMFEDYGPINTLMMNLGWISGPIEYWKSEYLARALIIFINMWVGIPYYMLLMSGLLINIPKDYYEAATIDGASRYQQFKRITFPNILFMTAPMLITSFVSNINNFNVIWFLTSGGPANSDISGTAGKTDILITWLYQLTMKRGDYNFGAAIGIIMFIISATLSLIIFRRSGSYKNEEAYR